MTDPAGNVLYYGDNLDVQPSNYTVSAPQSRHGRLIAIYSPCTPRTGKPTSGKRRSARRASMSLP